MTEEEIAELMAEEPSGPNHGYKRNSYGSWSDLQTNEETLPRRQVFSQSNRIHGFAYGYVRLECRCPECRAWKVLYDSERRRLDV